MKYKTMIHIIDKIIFKIIENNMPLGIIVLKCKECNSDVLGRKRRKIVFCDKCQIKNYIENQKKGREIVKNSFVRY